MIHSSPAPCAARKLARAVAAALFILAILFGPLSPGRAGVEAKSRNSKVLGARSSVAKRSKTRPKNERARRDPTDATGLVSAPTDGSEIGEDGEDIQKREEWFRFQREFPYGRIPDEARRLAWESRPTGRLKGLNLRGALAADVVQWTPIGPSPTTSAFQSRYGLTSGHVHAIAVKPDDPNVVLIGGSTGGIWRSTDGGSNFAPVTDSQVDLAVGSIAFAPSNPSIVYAGMGDRSGSGSYLGTGVLKSTDGGATWFRVDTSGLSKRGQGISIAVDPTDANRVYLCHFIKQSDETINTTFSDGFYVSADGGKTWTRTLAGLPEVVVVSPADPSVVFVSMARVDFDSTKPAGVYKSTDRGVNWTNVYSLGVFNNSSPNSKDCYVAVTPAGDKQRVYAVSRGATTSVLSLAYSADNGATWTKLPDSNSIDMGQWGYNSYIYASPSDADTIYVGTRDVWKATGVTSQTGPAWTNLTNTFTAGGSYQPNLSFSHSDQHSFAFSPAPADGSTFYIGNDGGLWKTTTGGTGATPFTSQNATLTLQQFVGIAAHPTTPGVTYGGTQDNGTQVRGTDVKAWREFATGDGGRVVVIPTDPTLVFPSYVGGTIWRYKDSGAGPALQATVGSSSVFRDATTNTADRIAFYPPFVGNGVDSTLYVGTNRLWVSKDLGASWATPAASADLTKGGSDTLSAIGVARSNTQVIYVGSAQGRLQVSQDGGATWNDISIVMYDGVSSVAPTSRSVSSITVDPSNPAVAYVTVSGFGTGHVWKTTNMGQTWADLSGTNAATKLPNIPTSAMLLDPSGLIYAGTDIGVFRSSGDGNWEAFSNGLPPVPVSSFTVTASGKIQAGTFGRGAYELGTAAPPTVQFASAATTVNEGDGRASLTVTRSGDTSGTSTVDVRTNDDTRAIRCDDTTSAPGVAFARCDYATVVQTLVFNPGETLKAVTVPIIDDSFVEPDESVRLALSNPTNAALGSQATALLVIHDNDAPGSSNPILRADQAGNDFFVRQQYLDFLSREPEQGQPWSAVLNGCAAGDASCDRVTVSAAFFGSPEFQLKGLFVFKFYKVSFGRLPLYSEIVADMSSVTGATTADLITKKAAFTSSWAQRQEFANAYGTSTNQQFVDALMGRYNLTSVFTPDPASPDGTTRVTLSRSDLVARLNAGTMTRGQVVRAVADSNEVSQAEYNPAFVAMQYFGYLRRDPDAAGYNAWLNAINANPSDTRTMVNGFVNSIEYRLRFGAQ